MLNTLTLTQALKKLAQKEISLTELYDDTNRAIETHNATYNIYLTINHNTKREIRNTSCAPLGGIPIAVKDNICTKGMRTTASSTVLDTFIPPYSATIINKLSHAGGVVIGKTNLDAWAHGSSTETSQYGRTLNPRNQNFLPGGSSGGSAAAVAADLCIASIGTETAGSIRQPSSWCGVVGLKPTYGRVSRSGIVAMGSSLDSPGPITKTAEDAALLLNCIAGHDPNDATTSSQTVPNFTEAVGKPIRGLKIGLLYHDLPGLAESWPHVETAAKVLGDLGCNIELADALDPQYAISVYTVVQRGEVSSNLARYDGIRYGNDRSHFGSEAKRRIMLGTYTLSKGYAGQYYLTAQKVRTLYRHDFDRLFQKYDALITLSSPGFAKKIGITKGAAMFGELEDLLLEPSSLSGLPGISVPCYHDPITNLFLGLNIIAPLWREDTCISIADAYEKATEWNTWNKQP